jgi:hypothetical protein
MHETARYGNRVQMKIRQDPGHLDAVRYVRFAGRAYLSLVRAFAELIRAPHQVVVEPLDRVRR